MRRRAARKGVSFNVHLTKTDYSPVFCRERLDKGSTSLIFFSVIFPFFSSKSGSQASAHWTCAQHLGSRLTFNAPCENSVFIIFFFLARWFACDVIWGKRKYCASETAWNKGPVDLFIREDLWRHATRLRPPVRPSRDHLVGARFLVQRHSFIHAAAPSSFYFCFTFLPEKFSKTENNKHELTLKTVIYKWKKQNKKKTKNKKQKGTW